MNNTLNHLQVTSRLSTTPALMSLDVPLSTGYWNVYSWTDAKVKARFLLESVTDLHQTVYGTLAEAVSVICTFGMSLVVHTCLGKGCTYLICPHVTGERERRFY